MATVDKMFIKECGPEVNSVKKNIILVGFMGTGKSSVGRRLAQRLQMNFYDTDVEMESVTGLDLMTLYWKCGKVGFV